MMLGMGLGAIVIPAVAQRLVATLGCLRLLDSAYPSAGPSSVRSGEAGKRCRTVEREGPSCSH